MTGVGITGYGAYVPRRRLVRKAVLEAAGWLNPALFGSARGTSAMANWDEDSVTMAVEAGRDCLGQGPRTDVKALYFAATRPPFAERLNAGIIAAALRLPDAAEAVDLCSTRRAGTSACLQALARIHQDPDGQALVVAGHLNHAPAASVDGLRGGDGAAALRFGTQGVIAEFIAAHSETIDFVDRYRGAGAEFETTWEERWVRDEGYRGIAPRAIAGVLDKAGLAPEEVTHVVFSAPIRGAAASAVKAAGIAPEALAESWHTECGDCGPAHPLMVMADVLEGAEPGALILMVGFGQGCDALVFRTTDAVAGFRPRRGFRAYRDSGAPERNYFKYLAFRDLVAWEKGPRARENETPNLSALYRNREFVMGLTGLYCKETEQVFFGPEAAFKAERSNQRFERKSFADSRARVVSWSSDYLSFTPDPPACYGVVAFEEGGRLAVDFTDAEATALAIGAEMDMVFRIKAKDTHSGGVRYVWKAAPVRAADTSGQDVSGDTLSGGTQ